MTQSLIQRSFTAGELAPALAARADTGQYFAGLRMCRNFLVQRHGGVTNRPGTRLVAPVKDSTDPIRLLTFVFEAADQTYVIEAGDHYFRFFWHGAPVVVMGVAAYAGGTTYGIGDLVEDGSVNYYSRVVSNVGNTPASSPTEWYPLTGDIYEVPTPFAVADVGTLNTIQRADYLLLTHHTYPPTLLGRFGHTDWRVSTLTTAPWHAAPASLSATAGAAGGLTIKYVVTAAKADTYEETVASSPYTLASTTVGTMVAPNLLSWSAVTGAAEYYVYADPYGNGVYGYIGAAITNAFRDIGFTPDFLQTPPLARILFATTNNYPAVCAHFQQRLILANTINEPETVWMSRIGAYTNFSITTPLQDDDAVTFTLASRNLNPIAHLIGLKSLLVFTDAAEWLVHGDSDGVIKPTAINAEEQGYVGADGRVAPVVIGDAVLFLQALGNRLRDFHYQFEAGGFTGTDLTLFAPHLFDGFSVTRAAFAQFPHSTAWAVRSDGVLLGLTYLRDQEIVAWHRHDTGRGSDYFEDVVVVPDTAAGEDVVYVAVQRLIDGDVVRFVERFASRTAADLDLLDAFFVDCGLSYDGSPVTTIGNLDHLEGEILAVVGDGKVVFNGDPDAANAEDFRVSGGAITLPAAYTIIHAGLPIRFAEIETLDLDVEKAAIRDKRKRVQALSLLVANTVPAFSVGPDADHLIAWRPEVYEPPATTLRVTDTLELNLTDRFDQVGRLRIRVTAPLPCSILGLLPNAEAST